MKISFNNDAKTLGFVLGVFNKRVDEEGFIVDQDGEKVIDSDGQNIALSELGVIKNGSEIYSKNNIVSLAHFYRKYLYKSQ